MFNSHFHVDAETAVVVQCEGMVGVGSNSHGDDNDDGLGGQHSSQSHDTAYYADETGSEDTSTW